MTARTPVSAKQRWTSDRPCPTCGGHKDLPRHAGRCWGYLSADGKTAFCTEVEGGAYVDAAQAWAYPYANGTGPKIRTSSSRQHVARYIYTDEQGSPLFAVDRFETDDGDKEFSQSRWDGQRFASGISGVRRVPFHLPQLIAAVASGKHVYVVEGEKDVLAVEEQGGVATCNPMGAGKWRDEFSAFFTGADVSVIQDDDERGRAHAREVKRALLRAGAKAQLLTPRTGKDASEHFASGLTLDDFEAADRFQRVDLGEIARGGVQPVPMLVEGFLPRYQIVWMPGESGSGKTWVALWWASIVLAQDGRVAIFDEETGQQEIANRLLALGVDADTLSEQVDYFPFPTITEADAEEWALLVDERRWDLAIFDAATDFLAAAGIKENAGDEVTRWIKAFPEQVRRHGTAVIPDHVVKSGETHGHAVGSRAKRAKAKVVWEVVAITGPTREERGTLLLSKVKDNLAIDAPARVFLDVGPDGHGGFSVSNTDEASIRMYGEKGHIAVIVRTLRGAGDAGLTSGGLELAVKGWDTTATRDLARRLATDSDLAHHGVRVRTPNPKRPTWVRYYLDRLVASNESATSQEDA